MRRVIEICSGSVVGELLRNCNPASRSRRSVLPLVAALLLGVSCQSLAGEIDFLVCGDARISVSPVAARHADGTVQDFRVTLVNGQRSRTLVYDGENEYFDMRCEKDRKGNPVLLVNSWCGGSGCASCNWGIVDLVTFEVLLSPDSRWKGNHGRAEALLGKTIKRISCDTESEARCYFSRFE